MAYFIAVFTSKTWLEFQERGAVDTGFTEKRQDVTTRVKRNDVLLCYLTRLSRWCGVLQVESEAYLDKNPDIAPFAVRFKVKPIVMLDPEQAIPIHDDMVWSTLSFTKHHKKGSSAWTYPLLNPPHKLQEDDGHYLVELLKEQQASSVTHPLKGKDKRWLPAKRKAAVADGPAGDETRESIKYQAKVAEIGAMMRFKVWVPKSDKSRILKLVPASLHQSFLDSLPLYYPNETLRTIEQIDVLWIKGQSMARAFEIEHTTAIYSGLLRMLDLLELQPDMNIRVHIVAPSAKEEKVFQEIMRPAFSRISYRCSYLSYDSVDMLVAENPHLDALRPEVIEKYAKSA